MCLNQPFEGQKIQKVASNVDHGGGHLDAVPVQATDQSNLRKP
jgi:hypothetical protein